MSNNEAAERAKAGLAASGARGREDGRKPVLTPAQVEKARRMLEDRNATIKSVAEKPGVNRATIYRAFGLLNR